MSAKKLDVTVLYVEDDTFLRQTISRILKRRVSTLLVAENGREGLGVFKEERPDIVVTDIKMPSMNGLEMSKQILADDASVPIIITTAHNEV